MSRPPSTLPGIDPADRAQRMRARLRRKKPPAADPRQLELFPTVNKKPGGHRA